MADSRRRRVSVPLLAWAALGLASGCLADPAAREAGALAPAAPKELVASIPVSEEFALRPEGGCIAQGDPVPLVDECDASHASPAFDLLANQTLVGARLELTTGGTVPEGSEPVLRLSCVVAGEPCPAPLAESAGGEPVVLEWSGEQGGERLRVKVDGFLRGPTAAATWSPLVASAQVTGELVVRQAPGNGLPGNLVRAASPIAHQGATAPCVKASGPCPYPDGDSGTFGPYEQPIEEVHVVASWTANHASNDVLTLRVKCHEDATFEPCPGFGGLEVTGRSPLALDEEVRFPPTGVLELALVADTAPGVAGPISQPYELTGTVVHWGDPDARHG